jgi:hypothetical protein
MSLPVPYLSRMAKILTAEQRGRMSFDLRKHKARLSRIAKRKGVSKHSLGLGYIINGLDADDRKGGRK